MEPCSSRLGFEAVTRKKHGKILNTQGRAIQIITSWTQDEKKQLHGPEPTKKRMGKEQGVSRSRYEKKER